MKELGVVVAGLVAYALMLIYRCGLWGWILWSSCCTVTTTTRYVDVTNTRKYGHNNLTDELNEKPPRTRTFIMAALPPFTSPKTLFGIFISFFLLCRLAWICCLAWAEDGYSDFVLNRVSFMLFFTAFTLIIFFWAETLHTVWKNKGEKGPKEGFFKRTATRVWFLLVNGLVYVAQVAFMIAFFATEDSDDREDNKAYEVNILLIVAVFGLICIAFLIYGTALLIIARKAMNTSQKFKFYAQMASTTIVLVVCFAVRFALFLYRPISGKFLPEGVFYSLAYYVPELVPVFCMVTTLSLSRVRKVKEQHQRNVLFERY